MKRVKQIYKEIEALNQELDQIREACPHKGTEEGNYSWRPGAIHPATFCKECGKALKVHFEIPSTSSSSGTS